MPRRPLPLPESCRVLLVGGGGREHALARGLARSPRCAELWLTDDANPGLQALGRTAPVALDLKHPFHFQRWCDDAGIDLVVVGPEAPLAEGIADRLATESRLVFGPTRDGARIEADKAFAKQVMRQAAVPTADARVFEQAVTAREYALSREEGCVVKAAGLAAGKGVIVCADHVEAARAVDQIMGDRAFGVAGDKVLIEERLEGQEVSVLALVDGRTIWTLDPAQDHKQVGEGDTGPNTGGMGAYCPAPVLDDATLATIERDVFVATVDALRREGVEYRGVLYAGLMLTPAGPKVLEFNCRFGDPECQALLARMRSDLLEACWRTAAGSLDEMELDFDDRVACCVVRCSAGYPGDYAKGLAIEGIEEAEALGGPGESVVVDLAGVRRDADGTLRTAGGRVIGVTALAADLRAARDLANAACDRIRFDGAFHRRDIGDRVLATAPR